IAGRAPQARPGRITLCILSAAGKCETLAARAARHSRDPLQQSDVRLALQADRGAGSVEPQVLVNPLADGVTALVSGGEADAQQVGMVPPYDGPPDFGGLTIGQPEVAFNVIIRENFRLGGHRNAAIAQVM